MPSKIQHLYDIIQQHPLERKILLAASHAQGHQWLEQVSRQCGPVLHVGIRTPEAWILDRCKLMLAKRKLTFLSSADVKWIVCRLLQDIKQTGNGYLAGITLTPGLTDAFHQAVMELRGNGVRAQELSPESFEQAAKGSFVKELLLKYEEWLRAGSFADLAGLLEVSRELPSAKDTIILDPNAIHSETVLKIVRQAAGGGYITLREDAAFTAEQSGYPAEETTFFHATGAIAEAREVFRRIVDRKIQWDRVEIIASSPENGAAVYTVSSALEIPCRFADGLPLGLTNAGKAAKLYLEWLASGFPVEPIRSGMAQGIIRLQDGQLEEVPAARLIRELERSGIGWGRERYKRRLAALLEAQGAAAERQSALKLLDRAFTRLFQPLDERTLRSPAKLVHELTAFVKSYAVLKNNSDDQIIEGLQRMGESMRAAGDFQLEGDLALRYVREGLERLRAQTASTPSPGFVHVTSLSSGGQTGRPYTFIIGMSESNWSPSLRQDPVLLDGERERISPSLPSSAKQATLAIEERNRRLAMIRGRCTMSYCSYAVAEQRENMPAYEMLQIYRRQTKQANADYESLHRALEEAVRYFRGMGGAAADASDLWLRELVTDRSRPRSAQSVVYSSYPSLRAGAVAAYWRSAEELSAYDGIVETGYHPGLPSREAGAGIPSVFSASMLERYGRCPLQYFYLYVLGVRPKEAAAYDRTQWLDAAQRGSLLHDIFDRYLMSVKAYRVQGKAAGPDDADRLRTITEEVIRLYAEAVPAPSEHIWRKEAESIRKDVHIFYAGERHRTSIPVFTELQLHGDEFPLRLQLGAGRSLSVRGFVDRVDEIAPHRYKIYDYKTGNPRKYKHNECFSAGTQLQLPLYGLAVEQWMKETGFDPEAQVVESAYVFPTERGMGEEVSRPQHRREELAALLAAMTDAMKQGVYTPAQDAKECAWCDYNAVCGDHAKRFAWKREAPGNGDRLDRILEVARFD